MNNEFDKITYQKQINQLADFYENSNFFITFSLQLMIL